MKGFYFFIFSFLMISFWRWNESMMSRSNEELFFPFGPSFGSCFLWIVTVGTVDIVQMLSN
ncbi:hypothetical protein BCR41DRAFT_347182 [Lobosporangium transversale]|uniref:Uncharacterized protein n=1 Tax=Lobosporangium transversale TaxID=64571 RepID=A0A1Y2GXF9_9FUNG|nr:hypothetical protein BCR41DRAFT_347182 [Lobosporangium transversale]ORZ26988.1 hypothetical protein BCR41DRAFT_347182 [Lobosporangium transversale]|eukprot:XP_021884735.1 hypothetical protein BCR41DRAFT_347182 [Lobosporangium transversale]